MPGDENNSRMSGAARIGVTATLLSILGLLFLMIAIGPLLNKDYAIDTLLVVGVVPVIVGAILLSVGIELPDWWKRG